MTDKLDAAMRRVAKATPERLVKPPKQTEAAFQRQVIALARMTGWKVAAFRPAQNARGEWRTPVQGDGKGWPDLVLVGRGRVLYRELKLDKRYPGPEQREWGEALLAAGADYAVWRPKDWPIIEATLKGEA